MAETRRQNKIISKGLKLPVTIEDAIEDALIVCLDYGARKYRGILLDTNKRYREIHLFNLKGFISFPTIRHLSFSHSSGHQSKIYSLNNYYYSFKVLHLKY